MPHSVKRVKGVESVSEHAGRLQTRFGSNLHRSQSGRLTKRVLRDPEAL